jgi:hypothetical protein
MYGCSRPFTSRVTKPGMSVWKGRFPGATVFGKPGVRVNPAPRLCSTKPSPGTTIPDPNSL